MVHGYNIDEPYKFIMVNNKFLIRRGCYILNNRTDKLILLSEFVTNDLITNTIELKMFEKNMFGEEELNAYSFNVMGKIPKERNGMYEFRGFGRTNTIQIVNDEDNVDFERLCLQEKRKETIDSILE